MTKRHFLQRVLVGIMAFLMFFSSSNSVFALSSSTLDMFAENNILFYDPSGKNSDGWCNTVVSGDNHNYAGATIFSESQMAAIQSNMKFYQAAAQKYNFPWQIIAVIHGQEHAFMRDNPANGQGAYQLYSYTDGGKNSNAFLPAGPIDDTEFQRQTDIAASVIKGKAGGLDLNTEAGVKTLFFRYNGTAGVYIKQAMDMGFTAEEASHGEGSPYVMNRYDAKRDPTVEPTRSNGTWGQIKTDGGSISYPANSGFGTFVKFVALGGSVSSGGSNGCSAYSGGNMDLNATAIGLAWPYEQRAQSRISGTPAYISAIKQSWAASGYDRTVADRGYFIHPNGKTIPAGKSCDNFVGTVVRYSGVDPNFPVWLGAQKSYLAARPDTWERLTVTSSAEARAGDIRIESDGGHITMVVEVNGTLRIASASSGDRFGDIGNYYPASSAITYRLRK